MSSAADRERIEAIVQAVAELPDRTSPDDWPDAMLVTADELRGIVASQLSALSEALTACQQERDGNRNEANQWAAEHAQWRQRAEQAEADLAACRAQGEAMRAALEVIHTAVRGDEKGECWTIRRWLDERDIFSDDISGSDRLVEEVCKAALSSTPHGANGFA